MRGLKWWDLLAPVVLGALLMWYYPQTDWDHQLLAPYFDSINQRFFLRDHIILTAVMHDGLKIALQLVGLCVFAAWIYSAKDERLQPHRRRLLWLSLAILIATLTVSALKHFSIHACPWDLARYGGYAPELKLFADLPANTSAGRCFPGGHSSGGYALLAFYFAFLPDNTRLARWGLFAGLFAGTLMGWTQMMRGAHFLSHNLWTLFVVWVILLLWYCVWPPVLQRDLKVRSATPSDLPLPATANASSEL